MRRKDFQPLVDTSHKEELAVKRCVEFQSRDSNRVNILAFSGGKDSIVAYYILRKSGIPFKAIYSPTSVDPPELIRYIREHFKDVEFKKYNTWGKGDKKGKMKTMWSLIGNRAMPPTRLVRYCCDELKERTGEEGDTVFTGVRWEESRARREQQMVNFYKGKVMVRPIIDWTETEVWSYILENNIPYCELYDKGWDRLGCIGCPLGSNQKRELAQYPKFREQYIRSFDKMLQHGKSIGKEYEWKNGEDVMKWWVGDCEVKRKELDNQCSMF